MAITKKVKSSYVCRSCGTHHVKWQGKCNGCGEWNTLVEEIEAPASRPMAQGLPSFKPEAAYPKTLAEIDLASQPRLLLEDGEMMRVLDGGIVPGSLILLGGEPGIGKSTLLLQLALSLRGTVLYVSGEESEQQVKLRAERLQGSNEAFYLLAETSLEAVIAHAQQLMPQLLIVDSVQTLYMNAVESAPGSVAQVRECAASLMRFAKDTGVTVVLVGHVNKEGMIAGPKVLEHMVDVVLEFEGDRHLQYRIVRSVKNRFGATPELGIYEMSGGGLKQVPNPSLLFLSSSGGKFSGLATAATLEGHRTLLVETQALVTDAAFGTPQRSATGFDLRRLNMLLAVLERKAGIRIGTKDVFVNLTGGIRIEDTALDLALLASIVSSLYDVTLHSNTCFAAEVSLTGELRPVARLEQRIAEAQKLGFEQMIVAKAGALPPAHSGIKVHAVSKLEECFKLIFG